MRGLLGIVTLCSLVGCVSGDGLQTKLRDASSAYNASLRWGDIDRAAEYLPDTSQAAFMARYDDVRDKLVIVDYEVTRLDLDKQTGIAASRAELTWHTERNLVVSTTLVDQVWQFHEGDFVLVDERRSGGDPLGLFAEMAEKSHPYLPGLVDYRKAHEIGPENDRKQAKRRGRKGRGNRQATARASAEGS
jgi:hypothetical protein